MYRLARFFAVLTILGGSSFSPAAAQEKSLTVFAAASMKNALDDVDTAYAAKTGVKIAASYAASSVLAKQIEQGAPADVFVSADTDWMDYAAKQKTIKVETRTNLLGNSIVLIAPKDGTFAGFAKFSGVPKAGSYTISLSNGAWIDLVQDGHFLKPTAFSGATDCEGIRKTVKLDLSATPFVLQISGARENSLSIAIQPSE